MVIDEIAEYIKESFPIKESGIVYCFSRKECEQVWAFWHVLPHTTEIQEQDNIIFLLFVIIVLFLGAP